MNKKLVLIPAVFSVLSYANNAYARDHIWAVGSSTVYPFVTVVAEEFGKNTKFKTPVIESTGTGGGFKLFCAGTGDGHPDLSDASRAIKKSEEELCGKNGISSITEVKIGYDGIVLANSKKDKRYSLTKKQIFLALAKKIPSKGKLIENNYQKWSDIDKSLPNEKIEVYGPPPTSGTRDAFSELVMDSACEEFPEFEKAYSDKKERGKACQLLREDGKYIEAGENDNLIVRKLVSNPSTLGIFGYSYLEQNQSSIQGSIIDGVEPTFENISSGKYKVSRPLFVYVKDAHVSKISGMKEFVKELISKGALGEDGYLSNKGLIPLPADEFKKLSSDIRNKLKL